MSQNLVYYLGRFSKFKQGGTTKGAAPHKPVFLLSLCELVEKGLVSDNRFALDADLVAIFRENFQLLADTGYQPDVTKPFYHLQNENQGYWFVKLQNGDMLKHYVSSISTLSKLVDYAYLDAPLFELLQNEDSRRALMDRILTQFFPDKKQAFLAAKRRGEGYASQLLQGFRAYMLNEPVAQAAVSQELAVEEEFVRGSLFKKQIPLIYEHSCAISGFKLLTDSGLSLLDACHIIPFSHQKDDRVSNGFALCPNLHRAFDRGWLGIDQDFRVIVSPRFVEHEAHPYSLRSLAGRPLRLPFGGQRYYPSPANFEWHRRHIFEA